MRHHAYFPAAAAAAMLTVFLLARIESAGPCPAGQSLKDPVRLALEFNPRLTDTQQAQVRERAGGDRVCVPVKHPEPTQEIMAVHDMHYRKSGLVEPGAFRRAVEQKAALIPLQSKISGAVGVWEPYGQGNLRNEGGDWDQLGARVDNFAYDPEGGRLFAAVGSGGVFMSEAANGDVRTFGDQWVAIDSGLPSTAIGAVAWTPAGGGTLIAAGGEAVMGSYTYLGLGAFWTNDLGATWHQASGVPDAALAFQAAVDPAHPDVVYVATSKGLFRSADAGRSYVNVNLPTSEDCAGVESLGPCQFTNYVTDVVVKHPGGATSEAGGQVLAAVGFRTGNTLAFQDGRPMAPGNGLYFSETGEPGSFARMDDPAVAGISPVGFPVQERIGRIEIGQAVGPDQDHNIVYAIVQDAVLFNSGLPTIDAPVDIPPLLPLPLVSTVLNGLFVSIDFGQTWIRMADTAEIANNPATNSALVAQQALGYAPGVQGWYNLWIKPDPTRADPLGFPTRLTFGLEEVWQNVATNVPLNGAAQQGESDFTVIGAYNSLGPMVAAFGSTTTHPDQHAGIYIPTGDGGVCLFAGNDGGVSRQCVAELEEMDNSKWGDHANTGMYALLPYGFAVARDGTVWFGLQDNGSGHVEPGSRVSTMDFGADGFFAEVEPNNSNVAYTESQNGGMRVTVDRGQSSSGIAPPFTGVMFDNFFTMDPTRPRHLMTGAQEIYETTLGPNVRGDTWIEVFNLGFNPDTGALRHQTTIALHGDAAYVGFCGDCGVSGNDAGFRNGIATNVGGDKPPQVNTSDGWHLATAAGLDNRFITAIAIDPADPRTIYVTLGGYLSNLRPPGSYIDPNPNIGTGNVFKSTDAGETFTDISGTLPRAQANSVVIRGGQLLVATDIGVFISGGLDGGTWAPLGSGMPAVPVSMIRLQPGNPDALFASTFGKHIWLYNFSGESAMAGDAPEGSGWLVGGISPPVLIALLLLALARFSLTRASGAASPPGGRGDEGSQLP